MVLGILEVSQKQAYIFSSNKLRENILHSTVIAYVTSSEFFQKIGAPYREEENLVYAGGGHTVLQFDSMDDARAFNATVTKAILEYFPDMEMFAKLMAYDENKTPHENLKTLISLLEIKKSERKASFKKGSYGVESIDSSLRKPIMAPVSSGITINADDSIERSFIPNGYKPVYELENLGGSKEDTNFVAIIHIDGNGMGKRVNDFQEKYGGEEKSWKEFAEMLREFSQKVDEDFKDAYRNMTIEVAERIKGKTLSDLDLKENFFPIRRIITSGDDICYISEGRIGIESARIFIEKLNEKTNAVDGKKYSACAGVAIVHTKYPFFRAYEIAELLCSNAKSFGAMLSPEDNGACVSSIDWHIEYGELGDNLSAVRDKYQNEEGKLLHLRPYIVSAPQKILGKETIRQYGNFKKAERILSDKEGYARSSIKELRTVLRQTEKDAWYYLKYHKIEEIAMVCYQDVYKELEIGGIGTGKGLEGKLFVQTYDGKERSTLFDAIEIMDAFIDMEPQTGDPKGGVSL